MVKVSAQALHPTQPFLGGTEIVRVNYALGKLAIYVRGMAREPGVAVEFLDVNGFRMLDERDMSNYWPTCSTENGWLFEIFSGGWISQEDERTGGAFKACNHRAREFLITGADDCMTVLCSDTPKVTPHAL